MHFCALIIATCGLFVVYCMRVKRCHNNQLPGRSERFLGLASEGCSSIRPNTTLAPFHSTECSGGEGCTILYGTHIRYLLIGSAGSQSRTTPAEDATSKGMLLLSLPHKPEGHEFLFHIFPRGTTSAVHVSWLLTLASLLSGFPTLCCWLYPRTIVQSLLNSDLTDTSNACMLPE